MRRLQVVQCFAIVGLIPVLGQTAFALIFPLEISAELIALHGSETCGRSLRELEA